MGIKLAQHLARAEAGDPDALASLYRAAEVYKRLTVISLEMAISNGARAEIMAALMAYYDASLYLDCARALIADAQLGGIELTPREVKWVAEEFKREILPRMMRGIGPSTEMQAWAAVQLDQLLQQDVINRRRELGGAPLSEDELAALSHKHTLKWIDEINEIARGHELEPAYEALRFFGLMALFLLVFVIVRILFRWWYQRRMRATQVQRFEQRANSRADEARASGQLYTRRRR